MQRGKKKKKMANWKEVPEDLLIEILLRLSVKSLIRFRCVSKTWRDLIKSTKFSAMHFECDKDEIVLIYRYVQKENQHVISLHSNDDSLSQVSTDVRIPYFDARTYLQILGPCNGLICITNYETIVLCNPVLQEFYLLPDRPFPCPHGFRPMELGLGFGFDPCTNDYKVFRMSEIVNEDDDEYWSIDCLKYEIYNLSTNSWREIDAAAPRVSTFPCFELFFNGAYFPESCLELDGKHSSLVVLDECLAMVRYQAWMKEPHLIDIWVMKEYGVKESWIKQFTVGPILVMCPLSSWKNYTLLMESSNGQLVSYALDTNIVKKYEIYSDRRHSLLVIIFKESLVSTIST
ncbi:unnamed protein product [Fraxinus pennsylvanica]|uniref:F-box domain-containing protein n=1 Tax=Fraxinus pennsylvanica TaxID=56036 RepID=A0AAD1ZXI9_9LAMI|nr:unnamed protein product [Fraxinus pennsylvanica]